jgi:hypothetical protein
MQATLHEAQLEHNELSEQLCMMQRRIKVLKHEVIYKQTTLMETKTNATEGKNRCFYSMQEDLECYHQVLIDMK